MYNFGRIKLEELGLKGKKYVGEFHNITFLSNEYVKLFDEFL